MKEIKISVDCKTSGYNKIISGKKEDIIKIVSDCIDDDVQEILIKKEPTHNAPEKKLKDFSSNNHYHI